MADRKRRIYQPVKRERAEDYLFVMMVSFAITVVGTRLFLELTGYPQLGNSQLHIAHVLWGGLLLFTACLLFLIVINRWVLWLSAGLAGAGVGLFIDEVGKFITNNNDYFFPFAAPIIYVTFLLIVFIYLQVRRLEGRSTRTEMYWVIEDLIEVLDHDLDADELVRIKSRLEYVKGHEEFVDYTQLASLLLQFLEIETISLVTRNPDPLSRLIAAYTKFEERWLTRLRLKSLLVFALGFLGVLGFMQLILTFLVFIDPDLLAGIALESLISQPQVSGATSLGWFLVTLFLEGLSGFLIFLAALMLILGRENFSMRLGFWGLLMSLTIVNVLLFYFDQFATVSIALLQFSILLSLIRYRSRFLRSYDANLQYSGFSF